MSLAGRLARSSGLVVGAGGLGSPAALALAAAGVGRIGLVDEDRVDLSNLTRQLLHRGADVGRPKVESGAERLRALAPAVEVVTHRARLGAPDAASLIAGYDVVVEGSDNLGTKLAVNEACLQEGKPLVLGAILRCFGQVLTVLPGQTACARCLYGGAPGDPLAASCGRAGVLGAVAGFIGMAQAAEALRLLAGRPPAWAGRLLTADLWRNTMGTAPLLPDPRCEACSSGAPKGAPSRMTIS
ncbi:MAG: HesA/MoeB/ThiF family protein [Nitrospinota bacterium]